MAASHVDRKKLLALVAGGGIALATPPRATAEGASPGPFYNVKDYGAQGDDAYDNTAAIQAAIDAAYANNPRGGTVYIPSGVYRISNPLVPKTGVNIEGAGVNAVVKIAPGRDIDAFDSSSGGGCQDAFFRTFSVDCNNVGRAGEGGPDLGSGSGFVGSFSWTTWDGVWIYNCKNRGIEFNNPYRPNLSSGYQIHVRFCNINSQHEAVHVYYPVTDSSFYYNSLSCSGRATIVLESSPSRLIGNHLHGSPVNQLYQLGHGTFICAHNIFEQAQREIVKAVGGGQGWIWQVVNNIFQSNAISPNPPYDPVPNTYDALYFEGSSASSTWGPATIANNTFRTRFARYAINFAGRVRHVSVHGNMMTVEEQPAYMQPEPFNLGPDCTDIAIGLNIPSDRFAGVGVNRAQGSAIVAAGTPSVAVAHRLGGSPTQVLLTPSGDLGGRDYWVEAKNEAGFVVRLSSDAGQAVGFDWEASVDR